MTTVTHSVIDVSTQTILPSLSLSYTLHIKLLVLMY